MLASATGTSLPVAERVLNLLESEGLVSPYIPSMLARQTRDPFQAGAASQTEGAATEIEAPPPRAKALKPRNGESASQCWAFSPEEESRAGVRKASKTPRLPNKRLGSSQKSRP